MNNANLKSAILNSTKYDIDTAKEILQCRQDYVGGLRKELLMIRRDIRRIKLSLKQMIDADIRDCIDTIEHVGEIVDLLEVK